MSETSPQAGALIAGRYRLEAELGSGAMGTVWSATDEFLRRPVAVKQISLSPDLPEDEAADMRERALREARATALLTHPNVVTLHDVVREGDEPFVVMELVPSQSLAKIIKRDGPLTDQQIAVVAEGVAGALAAAHSSGIIHRDVKPANVLIGAVNQIKLSDFGISRNRAEPTMTVQGVMLGTPAFVAPEIVVGDPVNASADLWSLGATLFAASEGRPPYDAGDPVATITAVARDPVPVPERTGPMAEVISGLLVKDPTQRMPLTRVKELVHPLVPTGSWPFAIALEPHVPTVRMHRPIKPPQASAPPPQASAPPSQPSAPPEPVSNALASNPGPLPFRPPPQPSGTRPEAALANQPGQLPFNPPPAPAPPRQSAWAAVALGTLAGVLFLLAAVVGFMATRAITGHSILPAAEAAPLPIEQQPRLVPYAGATQQQGDSASGQFTTFVPQGWTVFNTALSALSPSQATSFVSPDGRSEVSVQRYGGFYNAGHTTQQYLQNLPDLIPGARLERNVSSGGTDRLVRFVINDPGVTGSAQPPLRRDVVEKVMPRGNDLWVLSVAVPPAKSDWGSALFRSIVPGFAPTAG